MFPAYVKPFATAFHRCRRLRIKLISFSSTYSARTSNLFPSKSKQGQHIQRRYEFYARHSIAASYAYHHAELKPQIFRHISRYISKSSLPTVTEDQLIVSIDNLSEDQAPTPLEQHNPLHALDPELTDIRSNQTTLATLKARYDLSIAQALLNLSKRELVQLRATAETRRQHLADLYQNKSWTFWRSPNVEYAARANLSLAEHILDEKEEELVIRIQSVRTARARLDSLVQATPESISFSNAMAETTNDRGRFLYQHPGVSEEHK
ncbi:hypothetical protein EDC01DRAFT_630701 [Geopyxis carbonaria]|nr:hypothetical protein EDC01DRAFT_630701 [Geopyxis carbonaria]